MKNIVRKTLVKLVCDTYTCNNLAEYEIGHEVNRAFCSHYCADCMKTIIKEAQENFSELKYEPEKPAVEEPVTEENSVTEEKAEETKAEEEKKVEYYVCKYCGEKFVKPDELNLYRSHVLKCRKDS